MALATVIVDSREPRLVQQLDFGVERTVVELNAGDLMALCHDGEVILIERKTPSDLLSTLRADRLFAQCAKLREVTTWAYLVITGDLVCGANDQCFAGGRETGWLYSSVQGALLTVQELGVQIVHCNGELDYVGCVQRLAKRNRGALHIAPAKDASFLTPGESILASLPGIGPERARLIMGECSSVASAFGFLTTDRAPDGLKIPGIGDAIKRRVRGVLGLPDDLVLAPTGRLLDMDDAGEAESVAAA